MIKLAVFLGNPGKEYEKTRHNMAQMLLNRFLAAKSTAPNDFAANNLHWREKFHGRIAELSMGAQRCRLLQPGTFMNLSGKSVAAALVFHKIERNELLVVHDDLELPFGELAWREGGGLGGHNGLKSIKDQIGGTDFMRFRLGIGRPTRGSVQSWVLGRFSPDEEIVLPTILDAASKKLNEILKGEIIISGRPAPLRVIN